MAMPTSATAMAGASLIPSPTMATEPYCSFSLPDRVDLVRRQELRPVLVDADAPRDGGGRALVVPGQHHGPDAGAREPLQGLDRAGPHLVGDRDQAFERAAAADQDHGPPLALEPRNGLFGPAGIDPLLGQGTGAADPAGLAVDRAPRPRDRPSPRSPVTGRFEKVPLSRAFRTIAAASGWPERDSMQPARSSSSSSERSPKVTTSVTAGRPMVRVPVLSNATAFTVSTTSR